MMKNWHYLFAAFAIAVIAFGIAQVAPQGFGAAFVILATSMITLYSAKPSKKTATD